MKKYRCSSIPAVEEGTKAEEGRRHLELNWHLHTVAPTMLRTENWQEDLYNVDVTQALHQNGQTPAFMSYYLEYMSQTFPFFPFPHWQLHRTVQVLPRAWVFPKHPVILGWQNTTAAGFHLQTFAWAKRSMDGVGGGTPKASCTPNEHWVQGKESTLPAGEYSQFSSKSEGTHWFSTISHFLCASCLNTFHSTFRLYQKMQR